VHEEKLSPISREGRRKFFSCRGNILVGSSCIIDLVGPGLAAQQKYVRYVFTFTTVTGGGGGRLPCKIYICILLPRKKNLYQWHGCNDDKELE
jgi:hypothetical protein